MFTSSKPKKDSKSHHERGASTSKPSSSSHKKHHSRDSAIGSSITTASDRAAVGTATKDEVFQSSTITEDQRYDLKAVQGALETAYEKIKILEKKNERLDAELAESHKEIRTLKKERSGYLKEREDLLDMIDQLNAKPEKDNSPRSKAAPMATTSSSTVPSSNDRRSTPSARDRPHEIPLRQRHEQAIYEEQAPLPSPRQPSSMSTQRHAPLPISDRERRSSLYERQNLPVVPQPPINHHVNPFLPRTTPAVTYSPAMVMPHATYTPSHITYTTAPPMSVPAYAVSTTSSGSGSGSGDGRGRRRRDDGRYHLEPL